VLFRSKKLSTGIFALDTILQMIKPGDNLVWQVDAIDEYIPFAEAFALNTLKREEKLIYFRFADHQELLTGFQGVDQYYIDPAVGFERFTIEIRKIIEQSGKGACFVFDCLSDLPVHWYSDLMLGNFFVLICPFVLHRESLAYFALVRYRHSLSVAARIRNTTQILIDIFQYKGDLYIHPMKVDQRHTPTMYLPHLWKDNCFQPITDSATVSEVVSTITGPGIDTSGRVLDIWDRTFIDAQDIMEKIEHGEQPQESAEHVFKKLLKMVISNDDRLLRLAQKYLTIHDIFEVKKRLIGTGFIGGKSVGMLIARAILLSSDERWKNLLEIHDSFYVGSDVFYTFIVLNDCWNVHQKQRNSETFLDGIEDAHQKILTGEFPEFIQEQFVEMFDYFGQSPIIIRSSSLLEDNYGNAFSGKYESVFCVNQGTREERFEAFLSAVRRVYASTMSKEALMYRASRGLLDSDEQMALLVQRVSGSVFGNLFFPLIAGVGLSYNPYSWSDKIQPESGVLRIVCGLGTRAVDRHDDDYTRVVALNAPKLSPVRNFDNTREYTQTNIDALDLHKNKFVSEKFESVRKVAPDFLYTIVSSPLEEGIDTDDRSDRYPWILTFKRLLSDTTFVHNMHDMLWTLQRAYEYPVDIEFTVNFRKDGSYQINLLQCRPLQTAERGVIIDPPDTVENDDVIFDAYGAIIGPSLCTTIDRIIYVVPSEYGKMTEQDRYYVARLIGRLTHCEKGQKTIMLMGPGRWGTSMASLGVPVMFEDINTVSVLCEIVAMHENLIPDVSLGTHFFNDIVETKMLYLAIFPHMENSILNKTFLEESPNKFHDLLNEDNLWLKAIKVIDQVFLPEKRYIVLNANTLHQRAFCYLENR
jgi:hypothetical protein